MAEAVIMSGIEKLRSFSVDNPHVKQLKEEMEIVGSLVKEKKLKDRRSMLRHLTSKVLQTDAYERLKPKDYEDSLSFKNTLHEICKQLCKLGADGVGEAVGLEEDVKSFLHKMNTKHRIFTRSLFVAEIKGFSGSGKTTLARKLFHQAQVVQNFECRAWVNCKDISCPEDLLIYLVGQLGEDENASFKMPYIYLIMKFTQQLRGKRFFIVLDDSKPDIFGKFLPLLPDTAKSRSVLLLITHDRNHKYGSDYSHKMKPLDVDKSWELLLKAVSSEINKLPKHVERKAKAMLMKHSGGLPLAIKEVAMEWIKKRKFGAEWENIVESEDLQLRTSLEALDSTVYSRLDPPMKLFFLHLGFFKLGATIRVQRLLLTLDALGRLGEKRYYNHIRKMMVEERIIEIKEYSKDRKDKNIYVNGIFHKLSIMKLRKCNEGASYCAIYCRREKFNRSMDQNEELLCVSFNGGGSLDDSPSYWMGFNQLRVLDFEDFGLKLLPETIGELIELRYLGLRNNYIEELPHSLCNLKNLEVLDIALNFMVKVPDIICEMDALVHLYMSDIVCMKPLRIEALLKLKTLTYISVDDWTYEVSGLQMMTSLCQLGIEGLDENSNVSKLFASLAVLENLDSLVLRGFRFKSMPLLDELSFLHGVKELKLDGVIPMLPSAEKFPPKLVYLTLVNSSLGDDPMPVLENLEYLGYLKLQNAYTGQHMVISKGGFRKLERMCIGELWQLRNIQVAQHALAWLTELEIYNCPYLQSLLPEEISLRWYFHLKMVTTKNIATQIKKSSLLHKSARVNIFP